MEYNKCDICGRKQNKVGDGKEYKHSIQIILEMETNSIPPRIREQKILCWDLCNECNLSLNEQHWELYREIEEELKKK